MTGIALPDDATKANLDSGSDAVKNARTELASLVDKFNTLKGEIGSDRLQWPIELSGVTYASSTSFTVSDATDCHVGRTVQISGATTGTVYGPITGVSGTTITVSWATLSNETLTAWLGAVSAGSVSSLPAVVATGATEPRTLSDRFGDVVNVLDFGATGDGVTDDTAAIQAAVDAAETAGGFRAVWLPAGDYQISSAITVSSNNVALVGDGEHVTTITQSSATADTLVFTNATPDTTVIKNLVVHGMQITASTNKTAGRGLSFIRAQQVYVSDLSVIEHFEDLHIEGGRNHTYNKTRWSSGNIMTTAATRLISIGPYVFSDNTIEDPQVIRFLDFQMGGAGVVNTGIEITACDAVRLGYFYAGKFAQRHVLLKPYDTSALSETANILSVTLADGYLDGVDSAQPAIVEVENGNDASSTINTVGLDTVIAGQALQGLVFNATQLKRVRVNNCDVINIQGIGISANAAGVQLSVKGGSLVSHGTKLGTNRAVSTAGCEVFDVQGGLIDGWDRGASLAGDVTTVRVRNNSYRNCTDNIVEALTSSSSFEIDDSSTVSPVFTFETPGDLSVSYASRLARYYRQGEVIHFEMFLTFTPTYTTASGVAKITGLPYVNGSSQAAAIPIGMAISIPFDSADSHLFLQIDAASDEAQLRRMGTGAAADITSATLTSGTEYTINVRGQYFGGL